jgi:hypothetical protein
MTRKDERRRKMSWFGKNPIGNQILFWAVASMVLFINIMLLMQLI